MLTTTFRRYKRDSRGVSNIIVVVLSLVIILAIVSNIILWSYEMNNLDWEKMKVKYGQLVPYLSHRADLDFIFGELVGELNTGHCYINWGDFPRVKRIEGGLLGAELKADEKSLRYIISKIYKGENWNERTRSPLTEQGINVKEGDYLISLNGQNITTKDNPYKFLFHLKI